MAGKGVGLAAIAAIVLGLTGIHPADAQSFPERPIKIVVPYPAGGPADVAARLVAPALSSRLGQSVVIENLPGAGGRTGAKAVAQAAPDGYTLQLGGTNPNAIAQSLFRHLTFEPIRDFAAVAPVGVDVNVLVVNPQVPAETLQELIEYAKAHPGKLSSGATAGIGPHISLELLRVRTGTEIAFIPYKGAAPAVADLLSGQIQIGMTSKAVLLPLIKEGRLRALAVTSEQRWPELPAVPTLHEVGLDGIPPYLWFGLLAPARTPTAIVDRLNAAVTEGLASPELEESITRLGIEVRRMSAREFSRELDEEARRWEAAVKESGVKMD
jgi:tripartite-type tricarboxylate transporter receptor subunit TctC